MGIGPVSGEVVGKVGHLLRFFVAATAVESVFAVRPDDGALEVLSSLGDGLGGVGRSTQLHTVGETHDVPASARVVFLGPDVVWDIALPDGLVISARPNVITSAGPSVVASARTGPSETAGGLWMTAMSPELTEDVLGTIRAIEQASRAASPTQPIPEDAGRLIHVLARARRSTRVFELGTSTGAAALWLGSALVATKGRVTSVERDSARHAAARRNVKRAGLEDVVRLALGEADRLIPSLSGTADLLLLDEDAADRADHLMAIGGKLRSGALVISHGGTDDPGAVARYKALVRTMPDAAASVSVAAGHGVTLTLMR